jgi:hypothetical protein
MTDDPKQVEQRGLAQGADVSDLIGVKVTLGLGLWFLVVLACFFFVGPVAGIIAIIGGIVLGAILAVAVIRRADTTG